MEVSIASYLPVGGGVQQNGSNSGLNSGVVL